MTRDFNKVPSTEVLRSVPQTFQSLRYVFHFLLLLIEAFCQITVKVSQDIDLTSNIVISLKKQGRLQAPYRCLNGNLRSATALSDTNLLSVNYVTHTLSSSLSVSISNFK